MPYVLDVSWSSLFVFLRTLHFPITLGNSADDELDLKTAMTASIYEDIETRDVVNSMTPWGDVRRFSAFYCLWNPLAISSCPCSHLQVKTLTLACASGAFQKM